MQALGWDSADVILVSGDAYIDHPSFGVAVLARLLEKMGLKVAVLPQPNWKDDLRDFKKLGKPNLYFGVSAGTMDSMINHYTGNKRLRSDDVYTPGGKAGFRPDYATIVYSQILKKLFPEIPVIIGGIEASLRRFTHYDYWQDKLRPSILTEAGADLLVYGMGEKALKAITNELLTGKKITDLTTVPQTAYIRNYADVPFYEGETKVLPPNEACFKDKRTFAQAFRVMEEESNKMHAARLIQQHSTKVVIVNPPYSGLTQEETDEPYDLPYNRMPHPRYRDKEPIPAYEMIKYSVNIHRGCFGGCSFCTISAHLGKFIFSRSETSILNEVKAITALPGFKGHLTDLGGPSANMYRMKGNDQSICAKCNRYSCIYPRVCKNLNTDHTPLLQLYQKAEQIQGIKKITIGSGVRYDIFQENPYPHPSHRLYNERLITRHVSGRLKVAPEHTEEHVLRLMRKPSFKLFQQYKADFERINQKHKLNQQLIPYIISAHPGTRTIDMAHLADKTRQLHYQLEQVQEFTPTPMTLSAAMYYTGLDPYTMQPVYIPQKKEERLLQRKFLFWYKPENRKELTDYLRKGNHHTLIKSLLGK